ncbi:MAG TPA: thiamine phosphate synthase [Sphingomicrobium sp.]|nr:thiamine phosphate synthase [Sphingomicrobium sp.]
MAANQPPWPREWLMTDERVGDQLWQAINALPPGTGVVFRHYATPDEERIPLSRRIARHCREHGLTLAVARDARLAKELGGQLVHNPSGESGGLPFSRSAHSLEEAQAACRAGAALLFVSPIFPTRSHPGAPSLGHDEAVRIAQACSVPAIALGGVSRANFEPLRSGGFYGWAGINGWVGESGRHEVNS